MSETLKPCPFCGGTKVDLGQFEVYCQACGMGQFYHMDVTPEALTTAWNQRTTPPREVIESEVRSVFLAGYTLSANHRPYDGEDDRGEPAAWDEYRKLFDPVSRLSVVWCCCGDGIEDPKCETCYMTDRLDGPGDAWELWREVTNHTETKSERVKDDVTYDREVAEGWTAMKTMPGARHYIVPLYRHPQSDGERIGVDCFICPDCGLTKADEDGCCSACGADCTEGRAIIINAGTQDQKPRDSQMRAMIDQACEDLGRHGLQPTDEAAQVVLNLIMSASELGRLVRLRNEPSAVGARDTDIVIYSNHGKRVEQYRLVVGLSEPTEKDMKVALTHSTKEA